MFSLDNNLPPSVFCALGMEEMSSQVEWLFRSEGRPDLRRKECVSKYFDHDGFLVVENVFDDFCDSLEKHSGSVYVEDWRGTLTEERGKKKQ